MQKPKFVVDKALEIAYSALETRKEKPIFGDSKHIRAVRYHEEKQEFVKKMRQYCDTNGLDTEYEINKIFGKVDYDVEIKYNGTVRYTISALSPTEAEKLADQRFSSESICDLINIEYDIEVQ
jgi:hypothetical protein